MGNSKRPTDELNGHPKEYLAPENLEEPLAGVSGVQEYRDNDNTGAEMFFRDLAHTVPEVVFSLSPEGKITYLNPAFEVLTGWKPKDLIGKSFEELMWTEHNTVTARDIRKIRQGETLYPTEIFLSHKSGGSIAAEITAVPKLVKGKLLGSVGTMRAVARKKSTEELLAQQEKRIRSLYEISSEPGIGIEAQLIETLKTGTEVLGLEIGMIGHIVGDNYTVMHCHDRIGKVRQGMVIDLEMTYCKITIAEDRVVALHHVGKSVYNTEPCYKEFQLETYIAVPLRANGKVFGTLNFSSPYPRGNPFTEADKDFIRLMGRWVSTMIERKQAEKMLKEQEEFYRTLVENTHDLIVETNTDGELLYVSSNHEEILGYKPEVLLGENIFDLIYPEDRPSVLSEFVLAAEDLATARSVYRCRHRNGGLRWFESTGRPFRTSSGEIRIIIDCREITERIKAEEEIQKSLSEKEALLKEIHHRVKNNLQIISSLLSLQSDYVKGGDSLRLIHECQSRIFAIALIHERLYQSANLRDVKMAEYIEDLAAKLMCVYAKEKQSIDVNINSDDIDVTIDSAVPCGLIINELFSNCLKHAFPKNIGNGEHGGRAGFISVGIKSEPEGQVVLTVKDNGVGFPENLDFRKTESLGLQLVCTLVEQLNGTIELVRNNGTTFSIKFPREGR